MPYSSQSIFVYVLQFALEINSPVDVPTASNLFSKGNGVWVTGDSPRDTARWISVSLDDLGFLCNPHHYFDFTHTKEWLPHLPGSQCIFLHDLKNVDSLRLQGHSSGGGMKMCSLLLVRVNVCESVSMCVCVGGGISVYAWVWACDCVCSCMC